jgi:hypothetical protein
MAKRYKYGDSILPNRPHNFITQLHHSRSKTIRSSQIRIHHFIPSQDNHFSNANMRISLLITTLGAAMFVTAAPVATGMKEPSNGTSMRSVCLWRHRS